MSEPTVISTFAGCGGSSLGYKLAGFKELLAVEWDQNAVDTFRLNFPEVPVYHGDIAKLTGAECMRLAGVNVGELDVFDGSPPCQGFSTAGKRKFDDPRNSLFKEYARLIQELQPRVFVMENVTGMVKGCMKQAYLTIIQTLRDCGYRAKGEMLNAMYFNVPQSRERVIIIGVRNDIGIEPSHPKPQTRPISVKQIWPEFNGRVVERRKGKNDKTHKYRPTTAPAPTIPKCGGHIEIDGQRKRWPHDVAKKIATFPQEFTFVGCTTEKAARIGNSVPPNLMRSIAEHICKEILSNAPQA